MGHKPSVILTYEQPEEEEVSDADTLLEAAQERLTAKHRLLTKCHNDFVNDPTVQNAQQYRSAVTDFIKATFDYDKA